MGISRGETRLAIWPQGCNSNAAMHELPWSMLVTPTTIKTERGPASIQVPPVAPTESTA
jgi:hypothetical protein